MAEPPQLKVQSVVSIQKDPGSQITPVLNNRSSSNISGVQPKKGMVTKGTTVVPKSLANAKQVYKEAPLTMHGTSVGTKVTTG